MVGSSGCRILDGVRAGCSPAHPHARRREAQGRSGDGPPCAGPAVASRVERVEQVHPGVEPDRRADAATCQRFERSAPPLRCPTPSGRRTSPPCDRWAAPGSGREVRRGGGPRRGSASWIAKSLSSAWNGRAGRHRALSQPSIPVIVAALTSVHDGSAQKRDQTASSGVTGSSMEMTRRPNLVRSHRVWSGGSASGTLRSSTKHRSEYTATASGERNR